MSAAGAVVAAGPASDGGCRAGSPPVAVQGIACDVCGRRFQTLRAAIVPTAAALGWSVTDHLVLCPCCAVGSFLIVGA
jgi:hypothetical protein